MDYKNKLKSLLLMCIKKELTMNINTKSESVSIYGINDKNEFQFNYHSYYTGELDGLNYGNTITLDKLIEKAKNYKP